MEVLCNQFNRKLFSDLKKVGFNYIKYSGMSMRRMGQELQQPPEDSQQWPRKIFSGIQPTGCLHLGNYLGAVKKWTQMQNNQEDVTYCIVDMHSITSPQNPHVLRENIFQMAATLLACGIDPDHSTIFVQSAVREHAELAWILGCMSTMARLGHLPQFKEKTRQAKDIPLGLFLYPVLQAADIMLYKATHVPVGEDQVQHIQLAQHLAKIFNTKYGSTFPIAHAVVENKKASRIRSLRDPSHKMSKSDADSKATIFLTDEPEVIIQKIKKAVTDFKSDITYDPDMRIGVSNLIAIHHLVTGEKIDKIVEEAKNIDTGKYKLRVADAVVEHLKPIRTKIEQHLMRRNELMYILDVGADKARQIARQTMSEVRMKVGLGALAHVMPVQHELKNDTNKSEELVVENKVRDLKGISFEMPEVPKQELRVEKRRKKQENIPKMESMMPPLNKATSNTNITAATPVMPLLRKDNNSRSNESQVMSEKEANELKILN